MSIINNMPSKGGMTIIGDEAEYYVYKDTTIVPGNLVKITNGVTGQTTHSYPTNTVSYANYALLHNNTILVIVNGTTVTTYTIGSTGILTQKATTTLPYSTTKIAAVNSNTVLWIRTYKASTYESYQCYVYFFTVDSSGNITKNSTSVSFGTSSTVGEFVGSPSKISDNYAILCAGNHGNSSYYGEGYWHLFYYSGSAVTAYTEYSTNTDGYYGLYSASSKYLTANKALMSCYQENDEERTLQLYTQNTQTLTTITRSVIWSVNDNYTVGSWDTDENNHWGAQRYNSSQTTITTYMATGSTSWSVDTVSRGVEKLYHLSGNYWCFIKDATVTPFLVDYTAKTFTYKTAITLPFTPTEVIKISSSKILFISASSAKMYTFSAGTLTGTYTTTTYEDQVKIATGVDCSGVAKTGGIGGTNMAHKDKITIYIPSVTE